VSTSLRQLGLKQLDEKLRPIRKLPTHDAPKGGWIRALRSALGFTGVDLASRLEIAPSSLSALEGSEVAGTISLNSLRKVAHAMDCELVYSVVPRTSLAKMMERRAEEKADLLLRQVGQTMSLEAQDVRDEGELEHSRKALVQSLLEKPSSLWK
jgi:predicted DNA-binding mobile mystery protein A